MTKRTAKITQGRVNDLKPEDKKYAVWDEALTGFHVIVLPGGSKTYYLKLRTPDGRQCWPKLGTHGVITASQARDLAKEAAAQIARGISPTADRRAAKAKREAEQSAKLGAFLEETYLPHVEVTQRRHKETRRVLTKDWVHLHGRDMATISELDVSRYRRDRAAAGLKRATIERQVTDLKSCLKAARRLGIIARNPLEDVKRMAPDQRGRVRYLEPAEERRLRTAMDVRQDYQRKERQRYNEWRQQRRLEPLPVLGGGFTDYLQPLVLVALNTGMRRGELFNLQWRDVNLEGRLLTIQGAGAKSGQTRHIPLNAEATAALTTWADQTGDQGLVFPSPRTGQRLDNINKSWGNLLEAAGLTDFRFHDCRHHFASRLVMAGCDLNTVRELLGHASMEMTLRYAHLAPEHKAAAVALLNRKNGG